MAGAGAGAGAGKEYGVGDAGKFAASSSSVLASKDRVAAHRYNSAATLGIANPTDRAAIVAATIGAFVIPVTRLPRLLPRQVLGVEALALLAVVVVLVL